MSEASKFTNFYNVLPRIARFDKAEIKGYDEFSYGIYGDMRYRAPEVIAGRGYTQKADSWSFGVILFFLLSGQHPFEADENKEDKDSIMSCSSADKYSKAHLDFGDSRISSIDNRHKNLEDKILYTEPDFSLISRRGHSA